MYLLLNLTVSFLTSIFFPGFMFSANLELYVDYCQVMYIFEKKTIFAYPGKFSFRCGNSEFIHNRVGRIYKKTNNIFMPTPNAHKTGFTNPAEAPSTRPVCYQRQDLCSPHAIICNRRSLSGV